MDELIVRLKDRLRFAPAIESHKNCRFSNEAGDMLPPFPPHPIIDLADVEFVERHLGFTLPTSVRRLSLEVADGGFGPSWGIYRLKQPPGRAYGFPYEDAMSVESWHWLDHNVEEYESRQRMEEVLSRLPARFIRYCEVGCNITICVDCTSEVGQMFVADPNAGDRYEELTPLHQTVEEWLWSWVNDEPWPEIEYASFDIPPALHSGPYYGCFNPTDE